MLLDIVLKLAIRAVGFHIGIVMIHIVPLLQRATVYLRHFLIAQYHAIVRWHILGITPVNPEFQRLASTPQILQSPSLLPLSGSSLFSPLGLSLGGSHFRRMLAGLLLLLIERAALGADPGHRGACLANHSPNQRIVKHLIGPEFDEVQIASSHRLFLVNLMLVPYLDSSVRLARVIEKQYIGNDRPVPELTNPTLNCCVVNLIAERRRYLMFTAALTNQLWDRSGIPSPINHRPVD